MRRPAAVTALRRHVVQTRFVPDSTPGPKLDAKLADRIPEVRRLLRTDLSINDIAAKLGVSGTALRAFIKRNALCSIGERAKFISRQKSLARQA